MYDGVHGARGSANRLQGREFEVVIAWHPLFRPAGCLCLSPRSGPVVRARLPAPAGCIVVSRGGIREQLAAHPQAEPVWLDAATGQADGWEANLRFLEHLEGFRISTA